MSRVELKDYLHLYLGCDCQTPEGAMQLKAVYTDSEPVFYDSVNDFPYEQIKPILRPLSDMTTAEAKEVAKILELGFTHPNGKNEPSVEKYFFTPESRQ